MTALPFDEGSLRPPTPSAVSYADV